MLHFLRAVVLIGKISVSKTEVLGSNPSRPATFSWLRSSVASSWPLTSRNEVRFLSGPPTTLYYVIHTKLRII